MDREEMIEELLERIEEELGELSNNQLETIITDYKHLPLLSGITDEIELEDDDDDDDEEQDDDDLELVNDEWAEED
jgi:biotin-(acetyl-CoA carboxylase) ligase